MMIKKTRTKNLVYYINIVLTCRKLSH